VHASVQKPPTTVHRALAEQPAGTTAGARWPRSTCGCSASTDGGVPPTQVAEWAGRSVAVLLRIYAKCIAGQEVTARHRV